MMEGEFKNLFHVCLTITASLCYCYYISAKLPKGKWRLISLAPIFYIFTILPLYLTSAFCTAVVSFFITWLASFKLLLFAFDRPISPISTKSLPVFIIMAALPFKIKPTNNGTAREKPNKLLLPLNLATEIPISLVLIQILYQHKQFIHPYIVLVLYCCLMFLLVEILVASSSLVARVLFGMELELPSDEPYLSTSLREFWGRRWNLIVGDLLRQTIHKPIRSALRGEWVVVPAVLATFLVSGLMHELVFWHVTRVKPSWETTMFFVVQGVFVVVEFGMEMALSGKKSQLPTLVKWVLTLGFVVVPSFWLFFPPLIRNGADMMVIEELVFVCGLVKEKIMDVWLGLKVSGVTD